MLFKNIGDLLTDSDIVLAMGPFRKGIKNHLLIASKPPPSTNSGMV
jgi:hypothetical protein